MEKVSHGINWLQKMLNLQKNYGFFSIIKGLILLLFAGYVVFFVLNPKYLLERVTQIQTEQHDELIQSRLNADLNIRLILSKAMNVTKADRAWLIEFHNGSKNLSNGLPFLFGSMRIEEVRDGISHVDDEYSDFSLSKYVLIEKVIKDGAMYGNVEELCDHDKRLYFKFKSNNVNDVAIFALYDKEAPVGIIGLSFCNTNEMDKELATKCLRNSALKISALLTQSNNSDL